MLLRGGTRAARRPRPPGLATWRRASLPLRSGRPPNATLGRSRAGRAGLRPVGADRRAAARAEDADYAALVEQGDVFVAGEPEVAGVLVLRPDGDALMVENVAVDRRARGGIGPRAARVEPREAAARGIAELRLDTHERMT